MTVVYIFRLRMFIRTYLARCCPDNQTKVRLCAHRYMCRDELCLKYAIVAQLSPAMPHEKFESLRAVFNAGVNLADTWQSVTTLRNMA
eukprot:366474-Chlamydomonas_euryale.AAC.24